jgi:hypothetical protein
MRMSAPSTTAGTAQLMNIHCQPLRPREVMCSMAPESLGLTICENGVAMMSVAVARARSREGNQCVRYTIIPGKKPASATPSKKRRVKNCTGDPMNAMAPATMPQAIIDAVMSLRAPHFSTMSAPGTARTTYPGKNQPEPSPNTLSVNHKRSPFMVSFAIEMLVLST